MVLAQGGLCAICGELPSGKRALLFIDHDHKTGKVRGLLCGACNAGLGYFKDTTSRMTKAIEYLENCGVQYPL